MVELAISLLVIAVFCAFTEWRLGLLLCLATAILQDPLRKLIPGQPVYFVVFVAAVFGAAWLGALARGVPLNPRGLFGQDRQLAMPFSILLLLIIVQAFNSYLRFGNPMLPLIGLLTYLLPFLSIVFAYQLVVRDGEVRINQLMKWYIVCITLALTTVYLEFSGYTWPVLGQVGEKLLFYDAGVVLGSNAGIFRGSEIAAWHAMTSACFVVLITFLRRTNFARLLTAVMVVALLIGLGTLTGRRKIIVEFTVFLSTYFILWAILEKGVSKLGIALIGAALVAYIWLAAELREGISERVNAESISYSLYVQRSQSVFQDVPSRVVALGIAPVMWAYDRFGPLGAGLGVGSQGIQYFTGGEAFGGAAEGGLGKITVELGIPGLFVMGWFAISLFRHLWRIMRAASGRSPRIARLSFGLFSFLMANVAGFSVATQAYGDLFILLILSWTLGFLLAIPVLLEREMSEQQPAFFEEDIPVLRPKTA